MAGTDGPRLGQVNHAKLEAAYLAWLELHKGPRDAVLWPPLMPEVSQEWEVE